jgi:hypothetical protein
LRPNLITNLEELSLGNPAIVCKTKNIFIPFILLDGEINSGINPIGMTYRAVPFDPRFGASFTIFISW